MSGKLQQKIPLAQLVYGETVYWMTIAAAILCTIGPCVSLISVDGNVLNPHYLFAAIFSGKSADIVWTEVGGGYPGGHFWLDHFTSGDGLTQFGLALGCSVAVWALLLAAVAYLRERVFLYTVLSLWVAALVLLSAAGLIRGH